MPRFAAIAGVFVVLLLSGCAGTAGDDAAAASVAVAFESALSSGDGDAACALLTANTRTVLEDEEGACATAITALGLDGGGAVERSRAYARAAHVLLENDVLFLALEPAGWRVNAAGCTAQADRPYLCDLEGK